MKCQKCGAYINSWETLCESCSSQGEDADNASGRHHVSSGWQDSNDAQKDSGQNANANEDSALGLFDTQKYGSLNIAYLCYSTIICMVPFILITPLILGLIGVIKMPEIYARLFDNDVSAHLVLTAVCFLASMLYATFIFKAKEFDKQGEKAKAAGLSLGPKLSAALAVIGLLVLCFWRVVSSIIKLCS